MKIKIVAIVLSSIFLVVSYPVFAGFDFCNDSSNSGGNGTFEQQILYRDIVEIGELPAGIEGILIKLKSSKDVDIQLYDKQTSEKIVHWPNGILSDYNKQIANYHGVTVEWSGYNGDGTGLGNEYIKVTGKTNRPFIMKAYGYQAGYATVNYSWTGGTASGCDISDSGGGTFQQQIAEKDIVKVGDIPPGVNNLFIKLISDKDVDVQLYDNNNNTKIVVWPDGILSGSSKQLTNYQGMTIEWSGYNGDGTGLGHEYIKITGKTTRNLTMKAYGYKAGYATIEYSWGSDETALALTRMSSNIKHVGVHVFAYGKSKKEIQEIARNIKRVALGNESASTLYQGNSKQAQLAVQVEVTPADFVSFGVNAMPHLRTMINTFTDEGFAVHLLISAHNWPDDGKWGVDWSTETKWNSPDFYTFAPYQPCRNRVRNDGSVCPYDVIFENFHAHIIKMLVSEGLTQKLAMIYVLNEFDYEPGFAPKQNNWGYAECGTQSNWQLCRAEALAYTARRGIQIASSAAQGTVPIGIKFAHFHSNSAWTDAGGASQLSYILNDVLNPIGGVIGYDCYWIGNNTCQTDKNRITSTLIGGNSLNSFKNGRIEIAEYGRICKGSPGNFDSGYSRTSASNMLRLVEQWPEASGFSLFAYNATDYPGGCYALADYKTLDIYPDAKATVRGLWEQIRKITGL